MSRSDERWPWATPTATRQGIKRQSEFVPFVRRHVRHEEDSGFGTVFRPTMVLLALGGETA